MQVIEGAVVSTGHPRRRIFAAPSRSLFIAGQLPIGAGDGKGCLVQVGNGIELEAVAFRFEPYRWRPCGVTWDSSRTVVVIKQRGTSALRQRRQLTS